MKKQLLNSHSDKNVLDEFISQMKSLQENLNGTLLGGFASINNANNNNNNPQYERSNVFLECGGINTDCTNYICGGSMNVIAKGNCHNSICSVTIQNNNSASK